jgi:murein DD-endopeptidase MepM/ murein hydrolase activator NlpD
MIKSSLSFLACGFSDFSKFCRFFFSYLKKKVIAVSVVFESYKNSLVKLHTIKRGRYNRPFMHIAAMGVLGVGVVLSPFLADTYPILTGQQNNLAIGAPNTKESIVVSSDVFETVKSAKPRDKTIDYTVERGDTLSTIAEKFGISTNTIRWANDLTSDDISVGDTLKILPVTGIEYKVVKGDSVYSIAKKLASDAQKIVDFPFNDFANAETFSLVAGQTLIVPDGVKPEEQSIYKQQIYIAQGPVSITGGGFTWPVRGIISQFASWYHMAIDLAAPYGAPIVAAQNGTVTYVSLGTWDYGYGNNVWIDNGTGYASHYAHMTTSNVSVGQSVVAGQTVIGWIGMTGRTTGPHLHFELRKSGSLVNPLSYLQ